ncbi:MAG: glycosyltransferase family 2 protein [Deltaproteobacteria bacterium]|nr:glycosyltransferase family 2 protein [Deltaproteobacteria bacterium]
MSNKSRKNIPAGSPFLSVVVPCYNEEKLIEQTMKRVFEYLDSKKYPYEVIAVDDGSRDSSVLILKRLSQENPNLKVLENRVNRGKGYSVRRGFLEATGRFVCFTDADLSTPIEEIEKLLHWMDEGFDIAIGSRSIKGSQLEVHQHMWREYMGKTFNFFVQRIAFSGIKDTQCGFKCFKKETVKEIFSRQRIDGFSFDVEALYIAKKLGYSIKEVPIKWVNRFESRVNPLIHPLQMMRDMIKMRIWDLRGLYSVK